MAENGNESSKPNVMVLGGVGFIGRNFVHFLVTNNLAGKILVVDKVMPQMAWLNADHKESFSKVEFKHANLINPKSVSALFTTDMEGNKVQYDFVVNCAAETKLGQSEAVYADGIYKLSCNCAQEAAKFNVRRFVELSTAQMASSDKKPITEDCICSPWTVQAQQKMEVEQELQTITGLNYVILRPALVYGIGDRTGLTPRLVLGGIYRYLNEPMQMLWTNDYKTNTVHVDDVARGIWHVCLHGNQGEIYNLADKGDTTQGKVGDLINDMFDIRSEYLGFITSNLAKFNIEEVVEEINEKHMTPWGEVCQQDGVYNTPLTPYIEKELLFNKPLCVDGSKIELTGFRYEQPVLTKQILCEVIKDFIALGLFPSSLASGFA